jgi:hypothetical protein
VSISIIAQPIPQSPSLLAHRSVTYVQHILIRLISGEELTYFSFLNTLLRLPDPPSYFIAVRLVVRITGLKISDT